MQLRLAQQATLETRESKPEGRRFVDQLADWRNRAAEQLGGVAQVDATVGAAIGTTPVTVEPDQVDVDAIAVSVLGVLENERSTWTRWNLLAEIERQTRPLRLPTRAGRDELVDRVAARATAPDRALRIAPVQLELPDVSHAAERYTTRQVLDSEQALLGGGTPAHRTSDIAGPRTDGHRRARAARGLDPRRRAAGAWPRRSPATTAASWSGSARPARARPPPCTPHARSGNRPGAAWCRWPPAPRPPRCSPPTSVDERRTCTSSSTNSNAHTADTDAFYAVRPGDVLLVDEAGMAGTLRLRQLTDIARAAGAQVRLVGDPWQLGAVESGGALRLLVHDVGAVELTELHRFADPAEAQATLQLRAGDPDAIEFYARNDRIRSGSREAMLDAAYEAWRTDLQAGRDTVLIAATNEEATALNVRARLDRVTAGDVEAAGVELHDGSRAGVGDWIVTRRNLRTAATHGSRDFVKNGDRWQVTAVHGDGSIDVQHLHHGGRARLPAAYVERDVELGYAATAHRVQGATVDTAHVLVTDDTTRETLYVAASRARHRHTSVRRHRDTRRRRRRTSSAAARDTVGGARCGARQDRR